MGLNLKLKKKNDIVTNNNDSLNDNNNDDNQSNIYETYLDLTEDEYYDIDNIDDDYDDYVETNNDDKNFNQENNDYCSVYEDLNAKTTIDGQNYQYFDDEDDNEEDDFIEMIESNNEKYIQVDDSGIDDGDFVILNSKNNKGVKTIKFTIKTIIIAVIFAILTFVVYFCLMFKIIPENIKGANYYFEKHSIVSVDFKPNLDELKYGDKVLVSNSDSILPFYYDYNVYTYKSRNGSVLYVDNGETNIKIFSTDVDYILRNEN